MRRKQNYFPIRKPNSVPRAVVKTPLTEERKLQLLRDVQLIATFSQVVRSRWYNHLFDTFLNNGTLEKCSEQIYRNAKMIEDKLKENFKVDDNEEFEDDQTPAMDRVLSFFAMLNSDFVNKIMDGLEANQADIYKLIFKDDEK